MFMLGEVNSKIIGVLSIERFLRIQELSDLGILFGDFKHR
jgi:hypothetical protein